TAPLPPENDTASYPLFRAWAHHRRHRRYVEAYLCAIGPQGAGVSLIGESATELIHIGMMVLDKGLTIDEFVEQVFNYPTLSETYKYAAYDGLRNLSGHKLREG